MYTVALDAPPTVMATSAVFVTGSSFNVTGMRWPVATSTVCVASRKPSFVSLTVRLPTSMRTGPVKGVLPTGTSSMKSVASGSLARTSMIVTNCWTIAIEERISEPSVGVSSAVPSFSSFSQASTARA